MKQHAKWFATALAVTASLAMVNSVLAQGVTGTPYLSNMDPSTLNTAPNALYAGWAPGGGAVFTSLPTGLEVNSPANYGSLYYVIPNAEVQTINSSVNAAQLTFTVNGYSTTPVPYIWVGTPFILNDNAGAATYGGYSGYGNGGNPSDVVWNGNVVTWTVPLNAAQLAAVQTGTDAIYSFNLQFDPAVLGASSYDVTFNSLVMVTVPEPGTLALFALGAAGLMLARRRSAVN
jgi:hypothetical protein